MSIFKKGWNKLKKIRNRAIANRIDDLAEKLPEGYKTPDGHYAMDSELRRKHRAERQQVIDSFRNFGDFLTLTAGVFLKTTSPVKILSMIKVAKPLLFFIARIKEPKMKVADLKHLNKDTAEIMITVAHFGNGMGKSAEDKKWTLSDIMNFQQMVLSAPAAFSGATNFDLDSQAEREEACELFAATFKLPQEKTEKAVEKALRAAESLYALVEEFKDIYKDLTA